MLWESYIIYLVRFSMIRDRRSLATRAYAEGYRHGKIQIIRLLSIKSQIPYSKNR